MLTLVKYDTKTTGKAAQRDANGNLRIPVRINHSSVSATFDCGAIEHVGSHQGRYVTYKADDTCTLHFTDSNFPGDTLLPKDTDTRVSFPTQGTSEFYVTQDSLAAEAEIMQQPEIAPLVSPSTVQPRVPPRIVVP